MTNLALLVYFASSNSLLHFLMYSNTFKSIVRVCYTQCTLKVNVIMVSSYRLHFKVELFIVRDTLTRFVRPLRALLQPKPGQRKICVCRQGGIYSDCDHRKTQVIRSVVTHPVWQRVSRNNDKQFVTR